MIGKRKRQSLDSIKPEEVLSWFKGVSSGRENRSLSVEDVKPLTSLVNFYRINPMTDRQVKIETAFTRWNELFTLDDEEFTKLEPCLQTLKDLKLRLPKLIAAYENHLPDTWELTQFRLLREMLATLESKAGYIFSVRASGGQTKAWHGPAIKMRYLIEIILKNMGRHRISVKPNGPMTGILVQALHAAFGYRHPAATITSALRRADPTTSIQRQPTVGRRALSKKPPGKRRKAIRKP